MPSFEIDAGSTLGASAAGAAGALSSSSLAKSSLVPAVESAAAPGGGAAGAAASPPSLAFSAGASFADSSPFLSSFLHAPHSMATHATPIATCFIAARIRSIGVVRDDVDTPAGRPGELVLGVARGRHRDGDGVVGPPVARGGGAQGAGREG